MLSRLAESEPDGLDGAAAERLSVAHIVRLWWPLAASWLLMGADLPLFTAVVARMSDAKVNLAAYGAVVFPIALAIEAPIIMLLAASTALCVDWASYLKVRRFMLAAGAALTVVHLTVALTPLFDVIALRWIGAPAAVLEPARLGFLLMTPWTWSIAYRRFQQGVLIRCGRSRAIGVGTLVRLLANAVVLAAGFAHGGFSGIAVGASAVSAGVLAEAAFIGWCVQPVLRERLRDAPSGSPPLTRSMFLRFYAPLALTPLVTLLAQPIGAAAMSRMPRAFDSLAVWPAFHGLVFLTRALGLAFNEVVVALIGTPGGVRALRSFTWKLALATTVLLALVSFTPLARLWFEGWCHLDPSLASLGAAALVFALLLPALNVVQSFYQGALVQRRRTRAVTESVALSLATTALGLAACVHFEVGFGLASAAAMLTLGNLAQTLWLAWRARTVFSE
jgi:hypothetical protein